MKSPSYKILHQGWLTFLFHESLVPPSCPWNFKFALHASRHVQYFFFCFIYLCFDLDANSAMKECAKFSIRPNALSVHQKGKRKAALQTWEENASLNARKIHHLSVLHPDLAHYYSATITHLFYFLLVMALLIPVISLYFLWAFRFEGF